MVVGVLGVRAYLADDLFASGTDSESVNIDGMNTKRPSVSKAERIEVTNIIGDAGRYQVVTLFVTFISTATLGSASVVMELLAPMVTMHWDWETDSPNRTVFLSTQCKMADVLAYNMTSNWSNSTSSLIFETPYSNRPLTVEMGLVCERSWLVSFANTALLIGQLIAYALVPISERFGRRNVILVASAAVALTSLCLTFSQGIIMFIVLFLLFGTVLVLPCNLLYTQGIELVPPSKIPYFGTFVKIGIVCGQTVVVGAAWWLKDWFYLQLFHTAYLIISGILCWYVLDSPSWLAVRGRYEDARTNLIKILHRNGQDSQAQADMIDQWLAQMKNRCEIQSKAEKGTFRDLFKNKLIGIYTIVVTFGLSSIAFIYYGLVLNVESFGSGLFMDFTMANVFSLAALVVSALCLVKMSTRNMIVFSLFSEAVVCVAYTILHDFPVARTVLSVLARVFISPAVCIIFVYFNELFPTSVRAAINGFTASVSRPSTAASSFTKELGENTAKYVPFILFGALSFATAVILMFMPDTKRRPLVHTVDELVARRKEDHQPVHTKSASSKI